MRAFRRSPHTATCWACAHLPTEKILDSDLNETLFGMIDKLCDKPLINMESAMNHPCQALADWRTLDELKIPTRAKFVLSWAYHPKALPLAVPAATVHMAAMRGMEVVVLRPEGYALPQQVMEKAPAWRPALPAVR